MTRLIFFSFVFLLFSCEKSEFFNWNLVGKPLVENLVLKSSTLTQFTLEANFSSTGKDKDATLGFVISKTVFMPEINNCDTVIYITGNKPGIKKESISWYTNGTIKCRAFIQNEIQTVYSDVLTETWTGGNANLPIVQTVSPSEISFFKAKCGSNLINNGGLPIIKLGVLISTQSQPNFSNAQQIDFNSGASAFFKEIENLNDNATYYCRGFAENIAGTSLASNIFQFTTKNFYNIGEQGPAGGIVFYSKFDTTGGWNFLECSPNDLTSTLPWAAYNNSVTINLGTSLGQGKLNTTNIVNTFGLSGLNYAAKTCFTLNQNGFDDWFLPSRDELITLYQNLYLQNLGSFTNGARYWTSSGDDFFTQNAWCQKMLSNTGSVNSMTELKTTNLKVRPIRCF
jgi:hypothetical protein